MINERTFAHNFSGFWRSTLPNLEAVLRTLNLGYERLQTPLKTESEPSRRDLISEIGFRLAALNDTSPFEEKLNVAFDEATRFLSSETSSSAAMDGSKLTSPELAEVTAIALRISALCDTLGGTDVTFFPEFRGLGMLEKCQGDIKLDDTIIEIKYVDRSFRSTDFRQAIIYSTLANLGGNDRINSIILYNPLRGTYIDTALEELIFSSSGRSVEEFEFEFVSVLDGSGVSR